MAAEAARPRRRSPAAGRRPARSCVLTINGGSSSLKFSVFTAVDPPARVWSGEIERIGSPRAHWIVRDAAGGEAEERDVDARDHAAAMQVLCEWVDRTIGFAAVAIVGHRIVHGGIHHGWPEVVTAKLVEDLESLAPLDPEHLPVELAALDAIRKRDPDLTQVACFDTAFHHNLPRIAQILPLPRRLQAMGVRRFGFHGLSYAYLIEELARVAGRQAALGRVILAHLGGGASLAAVQGGKCVDTTMSFTPVGGLMMGTRSGDLDPGLLWYMTRVEGMTIEQFHHLVNHESGLLGVSETSADVRDLLAREVVDVRAREALALFCYQAKKSIGALAVALNGLDTLVFAAGIGENSPTIRTGICAGMEILGIVLDEEANANNAPVISAAKSTATVRVIRTDEESMIARTALRTAR